MRDTSAFALRGMRGSLRTFVVLPLVATVCILYAGVSLSLFPAPGSRQMAPRAQQQTRLQQRRETAPAETVSATSYVNRPDEAASTAQMRLRTTTVSVEFKEALDPTALEADLPRATHSISCPSFSGPGYVKERHPSRPITVPVLEAPYKPREGVSRPSDTSLEPVALSDVRLLRGSAFERSFKTNLRFLKSVDTDALLLSWKLRASKGWPKGSLRLMGWEHTGSELRGHFLGHYLSAAAYSYAATADAELGRSILDVVLTLEDCANQATGYLSAFPESFLDRLEDITPVWAPYYTLHKVIAGLLNVAKLGRRGGGGDSGRGASEVDRAAAAARRLAVGLGDYIEARVRRLVSARSIEHHFATLNQECGGINDGLWQLAAMTGEGRHQAVASLFDKPCLLGPLAGGKDELTGKHGNTALALVIGAAHRYELTGERQFAAIAARFFALVDGSRSYATGGSTHNELWGPPGELGHTLLAAAGGARFEHVESCTTHNMMRLVEMLLRVSRGGLRYAAWVERALINGVLGTLRGEEPGAYLYFLPLGHFVSKKAPQAWRHAGWSTALGDFWCCQGTGVEAFARIGELIFLHRARARPQRVRTDADADADSSTPPELYITQLVPASLDWKAGGMRLTLDAATPGASHASEPAAMRVRIDATDAPDGSHATLVLRVPAWARRPSALLNGAPLSRDGEAGGPPLLVQNGSYVRITRRWAASDTVALTLPLNVSLEWLPDRRPKFQQLAAVVFGPTVLACIGCWQMRPKSASPADFLRQVSPVPRRAYRELRSFHRPVARGAPAGTIVVVGELLYVREGELPLPPFRHRRRGATDVAVASTFRLVAGVFASEQNLVSMEPYGRPGCYVAAPITSPAAAAAGTQLRLHCARPGAALTVDEQKSCSWRRHDPLVSTAHGSFQSYESVSRPGAFLSTHGSNVSVVAGGGTRSSGDRLDLGTLKPLVLARKPPPAPAAQGDLRFHAPSAFALESAFEEAIGEAEYPPSAFWLAGGGGEHNPSALLYPLNEVVDEHYSVYFDLG